MLGLFCINIYFCPLYSDLLFRYCLLSERITLIVLAAIVGTSFGKFPNTFEASRKIVEELQITLEGFPNSTKSKFEAKTKNRRRSAEAASNMSRSSLEQKSNKSRILIEYLSNRLILK